MSDTNVDAPVGAWPRVRPWLVRLALAIATVMSALISIRGFAQARTTIVNIVGTSLVESTVTNADQLVWGVVSAIVAVAFAAALAFSFMNRLRAKSWLPLLGLVLVMLAAWRQVADFAPPVG